MQRPTRKRPEVRLSTLPPSCQQLVRVMQRLHHGTISGLHIHDGRPVFTPVPRLVRAAHCRLSRPESLTGDFTLKSAVLRLLDALRGLAEGVIAIEVLDGLPARWRVAPAAS
jgi:hypothetical protein